MFYNNTANAIINNGNSSVYYIDSFYISITALLPQITFSGGTLPTSITGGDL